MVKLEPPHVAVSAKADSHVAVSAKVAVATNLDMADKTNVDSRLCRIPTRRPTAAPKANNVSKEHKVVPVCKMYLQF